MAKLFSFNRVTLNGLFQGPDPWSLDRHGGNVGNEEFTAFAVEQLNTIGMLLFGRATYQVMASYWPTPAAPGSRRPSSPRPGGRPCAFAARR